MTATPTHRENRPTALPCRPQATGTRLASVVSTLNWASGSLGLVEQEVAGLPPLVPPGSVCFDIGAEYGLYTWPLSALAGPNGAVHSVEPLPGPARWLRAAATALGCDNVTVHRTAFGARAQDGLMSLPRRRLLPVHGRAYLTEGTHGPGPNTEFARSRPVPTPVRTVDGLCRHLGFDRVDFVKADVEGAEAAVLSGARNTLRRHRPALLLEIEDRHLAKYDIKSVDLVSGLGALDYDMYRWRHEGWERVHEVTHDCRNYLFTARPIPLY